MISASSDALGVVKVVLARPLNPFGIYFLHRELVKGQTDVSRRESQRFQSTVKKIKEG